MFEPGSLIGRPLHLDGRTGRVARRVYRHVGVYLGGGRVAEVAGEEKRAVHTIRVRESSLATFLDGEPRATLIAAPTDAGHGRAVVRIARSRVGTVVPYAFAGPNCEDHARRWFQEAAAEVDRRASLPPSQRRRTITAIARAVGVAAIAYRVLGRIRVRP